MVLASRCAVKAESPGASALQCGGSDASPFGLFKEVENGGKIIVMGDGMVSLYMTSWEGVRITSARSSCRMCFGGS
jgi:hypothetical protein